MNEKKKPSAEYKEKNIKITVWDNKGEINYTLQKSWKKKDETEWHNDKISLYPTEILALKNVLAQIKTKTE